MSGRPAALLLAIALDVLAGEPPDRSHPVCWIGRALGAAERRVRSRSTAAGAAAVAAVTAAAGGVAALVGTVSRRLGWAGVVLEAAALKPAFAARALSRAAREVSRQLADGRVEQARRDVGRHLVSRPTATLDAGEVASAAVESVAENLGDSLAGPLLAYALGGLPAAWGYRAVNTADAMWGYRDARYERFGKAAARLDDVLNAVPARLAAMALVVGAALAGEDSRGSARTAWRDHARTASPNAGWPMAAMAGALGVRLTKPGAYRLGHGRLPDASGIDRGLRVFAAGTGLLVALALGLTLWRPR